MAVTYSTACKSARMSAVVDQIDASATAGPTNAAYTATGELAATAVNFGALGADT